VNDEIYTGSQGEERRREGEKERRLQMFYMGHMWRQWQKEGTQCAQHIG